MRIHTPIFPCERDWYRSMKVRTVGVDEHLVGDLHYDLVDERNGSTQTRVCVRLCERTWNRLLTECVLAFAKG